MKKSLFSLVTLISCLTAPSAEARDCRRGYQDCDDVYVGGFAGPNLLQDVDGAEFETGFVGGLFIGYKLACNVRLEAEFSYRQNEMKNFVLSSDSISDDESFTSDASQSVSSDVKLKAKTFAVMANLLYDFDTGCGVTPYLGIGAGYAENHMSFSVDNLEVSGKGRHIAYQGIAGAVYRIFRKTDLGVEYRYFISHKNLSNHSFTVPLKRYF